MYILVDVHANFMACFASFGLETKDSELSFLVNLGWRTGLLLDQTELQRVPLFFSIYKVIYTASPTLKSFWVPHKFK